MTIYVDQPNWKYKGRWNSCHLVADSTDELELFALRMAIPLNWIQNKGTWKEHIDISLSIRAQVLRNGAQSLETRALGQFLRNKKLRLSERPRT